MSDGRTAGIMDVRRNALSSGRVTGTVENLARPGLGHRRFPEDDFSVDDHVREAHSELCGVS